MVKSIIRIALLLLVITLLTQTSNFAQEEIRLTTIMPAHGGDILRARRGVVGNRDWVPAGLGSPAGDWDFTNVTIPNDCLLVGGRLNVGGEENPVLSTLYINSYASTVGLTVDAIPPPVPGGVAAAQIWLLEDSNQGFSISYAGGGFLIQGASTAGSGGAILIDESTNDVTLTPSAGSVTIGDPSAPGARTLRVWGPIFQDASTTLPHPDYVFEPDYKLKSIEDHASFMWKNKHLPTVPRPEKSEDNEYSINLGATQTGILEELEIAHIYIAQLKEIIDEQGERIAALERMVKE